MPQVLTFLLHRRQSIYGVDKTVHEPQPIAMQQAS